MKEEIRDLMERSTDDDVSEDALVTSLSDEYDIHVNRKEVREACVELVSDGIAQHEGGRPNNRRYRLAE